MFSRIAMNWMSSSAVSLIDSIETMSCMVCRKCVQCNEMNYRDSSKELVSIDTESQSHGKGIHRLLGATEA
jgi:hypothetical protein